MKYKFTALMLTIALPSVVWAGVNFLDTDPVYVISNLEREDTPVPQIRNYRLKWNPVAGKYDLLPGAERRPILIEESLHPLPAKPQVDEPIYYSDDFSV